MPDATPFPEQVQQAVDRLFGLDFGRVVLPTLTDLGLPNEGTREALRHDVKEAVAGRLPPYQVALAALVARLDKLLQTGLQHVFLFRFPDDQRNARLALLHDPAWVRARLPKPGQRESYAADRFVWDAATPELTSVAHLQNPQRLSLKWVESRRWWEKVGERLDPETGEHLEIRAPRRERSVNFFWIDLVSGDSALAIQALQPNADLPLQDEVARYRELLREFFGFDPCDRVLLEPMARRLLLDDADIKQWTVRLPGGGRRSGTLKPRERFELPSDLRESGFAAVEIAYDWRPAPGHETAVRVRLDARADYLEFGEPCLPAHHAAILAAARESSEDEIRDPDLRALAASQPELRPVLAKLDLQLAQLVPESVDSRPLVNDEWLDREMVQRTFEALAAVNAERFAVQYYVFKPAAKESGKARRLKAYADPAAIPPVVVIRHKGQKVPVATTGQVWTELSLVREKVAARVRLPAKLLAAGAGSGLLLAVLLLLILLVPEPKPFQQRVFTVLLALAAGGLAATLISGSLQLTVINKRLGYRLSAAGGLGVFVFVFLVDPLQINVTARPSISRFDPGRPLSLQQALEELEERFGETIILRCGERERKTMLRGRAVEAPTLALLVERLRH
ncbi:MAG: hypothetical protein ACRD2T_15435, partial [Thermoanaerobaculia bacterium]